MYGLRCVQFSSFFRFVLRIPYLKLTPFGACVCSYRYATSTGQVIAITADHTIIFHETTAFQRTKLLVGFNDEILDVKYLSEERIAVACNSEHVRR